MLFAVGCCSQGGAVQYATEFNFTDDFSNHGYTVINSNNDDYYWKPSDSGAKYDGSFATKDADDWLVSPFIHLEAGKAYEVTASVASSRAHMPERIEVKAGLGKTVGDMTIEVIPASVVATVYDEPISISGIFIPTETNDYSLGFHAISDAGEGVLRIYSCSVSDGQTVDIPSPVENLTLTSSANGDLDVTVAFTAPLKSVGGNDLSGDLECKIFNGENLVKTVTAQPGEDVATTVSVAERGTYDFTVVVSAFGQDSFGVTESVFVGPYAAKAPTNATVVESSTGFVTVSWDAVTEDANGRPLAEGNASYMVYRADEEGALHSVLDANCTDCSVTFQAIEDITSQQFVSYYVYAFNRDAKSATGAVTNQITVGTPYTLPVHYSSTSDFDSYVYDTTVENQYYSSWALLTDASGVSAQDGDDCYLAFYGRQANFWGEMTTGLIDLTTALHPQLVFYTYKLDQSDINTVQVMATAENQIDVVATITHSTNDGGSKWHKHTVNLEQYVGKVVQLTLKATIVNMAYTLFDNICISETLEKDLEVAEISAPNCAKSDDPFNVKVQVCNNGYTAAENFAVQLYRDGEAVDVQQVANLEAAQSKELTFTSQFTPFDENAEAVFSAEVIFDGDMLADNNESEEVAVKRVVSTLPVVENLTGQSTPDGVSLEWDAYDPATLQHLTLTEDFELAEAWADEVAGWTFVDVDQQPMGGFIDIDLPNHTTGETLASFFVFDSSWGVFNGNSTCASNSGTKCLVTMYRDDDRQQDEWAISPKLTGEAQTITFNAKSYNSDYPENIEVWYATEDTTTPTDFTLLASFNELPMAWTGYTAELPEGAQRFAIRSCAYANFMLMLDDITFSPEVTADIAPTLLGYDVYRDGAKINDAPVEVAEYLDAEASEGAHTYYVVAKYNRGESGLSNPCAIEMSGLNSVKVSALTVKAVDGEIIVSGAAGQPVKVFTVDGRCIFSGYGDCRISALPAVYVVTVNACPFKLLLH